MWAREITRRLTSGHSKGVELSLSETPDVPPSPNKPVTGRTRETVIWLDRVILGFSRAWVLWLSLIIGIYAGLPVVAPVAMHFGATNVGNAIYTLYTPVCHQFAFRSWFLFGEQVAYPRQLTGVPANQSFEYYAAQEPAFDGIDPAVLDGDLQIAAKRFAGSERMGWKIAFCERDFAIYAALALFGLVFFVAKKLGRTIPPLPFWAYLLIAIAPIGLDGFSQLFANPPFYGFGLDFYPIRESSPFLRSFTGALFGLGNGWLAYPYMEESMEETRIMLEGKLKRAGVLKSDAPDGVDEAAN
jgi:uncharacterized membrane protein